MNLREQRYVLAIGKHGSIKEAAKELCVSPPTLSIFLGNLERELGVALFDRLGKHMVPTYAGKTFLEYAGEMVRLDTEFTRLFTDITKEQVGVLNLGLHRRRTTYLLPPILGSFMKTHPKVEVHLCEAGTEILFDKLLSGDLDIIINSHVRNDKEGVLEYIPFYRDRLVMVLSPSHPMAGMGHPLEGEALPWMDLSHFNGETFILQRSNQASRDYVNRVISHAGAKPGRTIIISNMEAASQLAAEGIGLAFNLLSYTCSYNYPKPVQYFLVGDPEMRIPYYITRRKDRHMPSYIEDFIATMKAMWDETGNPPCSGDRQTGTN